MISFSTRKIIARIGVLFFAISLSPTIAKSQAANRDSCVLWLQQNASPIRSIDPADEDFSDVAPLGAAISTSSIVMLGEQLHGAGAQLLAPTRVIKYRHEKLGFNVLAFESGFYEMPKVWNALRSGKDARKAVLRGANSIWTESREMQPLFDYVASCVKSEHPLELAGFDNQFVESNIPTSVPLFRAELRAFLGTHGIDTAPIPDWSKVMKQLDDVPPFARDIHSANKEQFARFQTSWTDMLQRIDRIPLQDTFVAQWKQTLKGTLEFARQMLTIDLARMKLTDQNVRDIPMGDNLLWLARQKYPSQKIIVRAASEHVMRSNEAFKPAVCCTSDTWCRVLWRSSCRWITRLFLAR